MATDQEDAAEGEAANAASEVADDVARAVVDRFPASVPHVSHSQPVVYIEPDAWHDVAQYLRDDERFTQCVDVTAVDHLVDVERATIPGVTLERFEVVANFLSHPRNRRLRVICELSADTPALASLVDLYPGLNFAEREVFDLFGIDFDGHPDLTRILMPEDWVGYPLRKDDAPARIPVVFKEDPGPR